MFNARFFFIRLSEIFIIILIYQNLKHFICQKKIIVKLNLDLFLFIHIHVDNKLFCILFLRIQNQFFDFYSKTK